MGDDAARTSRRDVLKTGGMMAAGAATFFAGTAAIAQGADAAEEPRATGHIPTSIRMEVGGVQVKRVRSASNASVAVNVAATTENGVTVLSRGNSLPPTVTVTRTLDGDPMFRTWFDGQASSTGGLPAAIKQTVVLTLLGRHGSSVSRMTLTNAWPTVWGRGTWTVPETKAVQLTEQITIIADSATFQ
jgi:hypothetical protein